jgi:hypothetical protein
LRTQPRVHDRTSGRARLEPFLNRPLHALDGGTVREDDISFSVNRPGCFIPRFGDGLPGFTIFEARPADGDIHWIDAAVVDGLR